MTTVLFLKRWEIAGKVYRQGTVVQLPDPMADRLVQLGVVQLRHAPIIETKAEGI